MLEMIGPYFVYSALYKKSYTMKKLLLIIFCSISISFIAQNIDDNKINFDYIQLPKVKVPDGINSFFITYKNSFDAENQRQQLIYQARLDSAQNAYSLQVSNYEQQHDAIRKQYLAQMSAWKQTVNSGGTATMPPAPVYPNYPEPIELDPPVVTMPINDLGVQSNIKIDGFESSNSGIEISIDNAGLDIMNVQKKYITNPSNNTKSYQVVAYYKMPMMVKASVNGTTLYEKTFYAGSTKQILFSGKTEYDYLLKLMLDKENKVDVWKEVQTKIWKNTFNKISSDLNEAIGFPVKNNLLEVYTVKRFKDWQYSELLEALTYAQTGYNNISKSISKEEGKESLIKAIEIWETLLGESDMADKKARINKEITCLIYTNLADAYFWMEDFEKVNFYVNNAITHGTLKARKHCKKLQKKIAGFQSRYEAYYEK